nr:hypothetical protein [Acidimicrobiia bacterium]
DDATERAEAAATPRTGARGWRPMAAAAIEPRFQHLQVWTGTEVVVFGGYGDDGEPIGGGAAYNPTAGTWRTIADPPLRLTIADWTGSEVLALTTDGELWDYDPADDDWRELTTSPYDGEDEIAGTIAVAGWTGSELVIAYTAAAADGRAPGDSAAYDPATDTWRTLPGAPFDITFADAVWTGEQLVVAGDTGAGGSTYPRLELWALDPAAGRWTELPAPPLADVERRSHGFAVWTGTEVVIGGGHAAPEGAQALAEELRAEDRSSTEQEAGLLSATPRSDAAAYDPGAGTWRSLPPAPVPVDGLDRYGETWTGAEVLVWTALENADPRSSDQAVLFDPVTGAWRVSELAVEGAHLDAPATWTGSELVVWSGEVTATDANRNQCCVPSPIGSTFTP